MLKLVKYEFLKNRFILVIAAVIFALLEGWFLVSYMNNNVVHMGNSSIALMMATMVMFFLVFILGITSYNNEMKSKQGYMIFMTPNSSFKIIMSKLVYVFILGVVVVGIIGTLAIFDISLVVKHLDNQIGFFEIFEMLKKSFGIDLLENITIIGIQLVNEIISFASVIVVAYFSITMSATLLHNKKGRGFISFVVFLLITLGLGKLEEILHISAEINVETIMTTITSIMPTFIFNSVVSVIAIIGTTYLLDKKISL